ncbi:MAG: WD40/YVTN/BNR-like repeat-containing protein [Treponema sp.]
MKKITLLFFVAFMLFLSCDNQYSEDEKKESLFFSGACSEATNIMVGSSGQILKNANGVLAWEKVESHTDKNLIDAYFDATTSIFYVAGHYGTVAFSDDDGNTWHSRNASPEYHLFGIATNGNKIMVVGKALTLLVSKDGGNNWEKKHSGVKSLSFYDIAFGNGFWVAVGDYSNVLVFNDATGEITEPRAGINKKLKSIAFNKVDNCWVALGHEGVIFTSHDNGSSWEQKTVETTEDLLSVAFNGKRFVAVGTNGIILTSKNGNVWNKVQINNSSTFRSVSCTKNKWLAITIDGKKEILDDSKIE